MIELLIVLAIIGVLLTITVPAIVAARNRAKAVACASNLRQIGAAIAAYEVEHHRAPAALLMPEPFGMQMDSPIPLYDVLAQHLAPQSPIYRCPADNGQVYDRCASASSRGLGISYFYGESLRRLRLLVSHRGFRMADYNIAMTRVGTVHRRGRNVLFTDGSVQWLADGLR